MIKCFTDLVHFITAKIRYQRVESLSSILFALHQVWSFKRLCTGEVVKNIPSSRACSPSASSPTVACAEEVRGLMTGNAGASKPSVSAVWARWMDEDGEDCHRWRRSYDSCGGWRRKSWHSTASSTCGCKKERKKREKQERIMTGGRRPDRTEVASVDDDEACELVSSTDLVIGGEGVRSYLLRLPCWPQLRATIFDRTRGTWRPASSRRHRPHHPQAAGRARRRLCDSRGERKEGRREKESSC